MADDDNKLSIPSHDDDNDEGEEFDPPVLNQHTMNRWIVQEDDIEPEKPQIPIQQYERPKIDPREKIVDEDFYIDPKEYLVLIKTSATLKACLLFSSLWALFMTGVFGYLWINGYLACIGVVIGD